VSDDSESGLVTIAGEGEDPSFAGAPALHDTGARVGRYVVLSVVGRGGMGVVYAAYDPELDRKVALKLLRPGTGSSGRTLDHHARLLREAQALARVSHPNVVVVHDVGSVDDEVFVAMEFVEGESLDRWRARGRSWREVLDVFIKAGRGLAAAHAAGLVHRDFKPTNVLVGDDGRVRVLDFGLARAAIEIEREPGPRESSVTSSSLGTQLTRTGVAMGTPAYMAPEQHLGGTVDARSDVFGFCVALYEALYGERPFAGQELSALVGNVLDGRVREAPERSEVPSWLRRVVVRGLALSPDARPASMDELLRELSDDSRATLRRRLAVAALTGVLLIGGVTIGLLAEQDAELCRIPDERLAGVWDGERREAARDAFARTERPYAAQAFQHAALQLDAYVGQWRAGWQDACEATQVRGEQSEQLLDLRMACLQQGLVELLAVSDLLVVADADVVAHAVELVEGLPELDTCSDAARLTARVPLPDPERAAEVEALEARLARVRALESAGKYREALALTPELLAAARSSGHAPLEGRVHLVHARLLVATDASPAAAGELSLALHAALRGRDDELAARVTTLMIEVLGYRLERKDEALERSEEAAAWIVRLGGDDHIEAERLERLAGLHREYGELDRARAALDAALQLREHSEATPSELADLAVQRATLEHAEGKPELARDHLHDALGQLEAIYGAQHPALTAALNNLGVIEQQLGHFEAARSYFERVRTIETLAVGPRSSGVALALLNLGALASEEGRLDQAIADLRLSREIYVEVHGPVHADVAAATNTLAIALAGARRFEEASATFVEVLALKRQIFGDDAIDVAFAEHNVGNVLVDQGKHAEGMPHLHTALEMKRRLLGSDHPTVASTLGMLGIALEQAGRFDEALRHHREALAILEAKLEPDNVRLADPLLGIGRCQLAGPQPSEAREPLERAHRILSTSQLDPVEQADAAFALARVLWLDASEQARADALAGEAEAAYLAAGERAAGELSRLREWERYKKRPIHTAKQ
jgi:tetratricopeptide (TPR) repeat protein/predicted Ser/Thr protein kinase